MSVRRRMIAARLERWLEESERLKGFNLKRHRVARYVASQTSRMGRYLRYRKQAIIRAAVRDGAYL